jgi:E3 ubiquitin-protein ligase BRE1
MNARLQEQMVDKEDMNANSLSTILHLRQLSEQLEGGKSILEKKLKSAEQLAVMSRLAANAREKVEKESMREKEVAEEELRSLKTKYEEVVKQNDDLQVDLNKTSAHVEKARNDLVALQNRCDNLTSSSTENEKQVNQLSEDLVVAKKDAVEAMQKVAIATASTGGNGTFNSEFTAEQLTIQVNQLKSRIACPVCNTRDKKVIINRCRHMFCRHCVALSLESRNRKCPSCGLRFDKKDVEDVWF